MDRILLKSARIIAPGTPYHGKRRDILIVKGRIQSIATGIEDPKAHLVQSKDLHVSMGWCDIAADFCDPGFEYRETLISGSRAAAAGGYTAVGVLPSTDPVVQGKREVEYTKRGEQAPVALVPMGALTVNLDEGTPTEIYDMHRAGARAFTNGDHPLADAGALMRALQYVKPINSLVVHRPSTPSISRDAVIHEGKASAKYGLYGDPSLSEELMVSRDLRLAEYADSRLHLLKVSTKGSVELLRRARRRQGQWTASVSVHHLLLLDTDLADFDANYKFSPPLRGRADRSALIKALADGTIDVITSDHRPRHEDEKLTTLEDALSGATSLELAYAVANTAVAERVSQDTLIAAMAANPRSLLGLEQPVLAEGQDANCTVFDPTVKWTPTDADLCSISSNTPYLGRELTGRVLGVVNQGVAAWNNWWK